LLLTAGSHLAWANDEAAPDNAAAAELSGLSLEELLGVEVVYAASRREQSPAEAPASVTIVTADQIARAGYRTLGEILNSVNGFYITYDRNYHYIGMRGFNRPGDVNSRILLLVNGHRLNDNVSGSASIGLDFPVNVDLIDRVEVVRGPSSSLYGTSAFLAVVNVVTRRGRDQQGLMVSAAASSHDTWETQFAVGKKFANGVDVLISGTLLDSDGQDLFFAEFDAPETNFGVASGVDGQEVKGWFTQVNFEGFTLQAASASSDKHIPTASNGTVFNDPRNQTVDKSSHVDLRYEHVFDSGLGLTTRLFFDRNEYEGAYVYAFSDQEDEEPTLAVNRDFSLGRWWGTEVLATRELGNHLLIVGAEFQSNERQEQGNYSQGTALLDERSTTNWGAFVQDEFRLNDKLELYAGVRYDYYETFGDTTNPRLGLVYDATKSSTVKLIYGTAFRAPTAYEDPAFRRHALPLPGSVPVEEEEGDGMSLQRAPGRVLFFHDEHEVVLPIPELDPERIRTYEAVVEHQFSNRWLGSVATYFYEIEDLISLVTDPESEYLFFTNIDEVDSKGLELELQRKWRRGLEAYVSYAYNDSEDKMTGEELSNSPQHLFDARFGAPLVLENLFSTLELQYIGDRRSVTGTSIDAALVANFTLFSRVWHERLEISGSVYNLFDEHWADPGSEVHVQESIPRDGRTWRLKFRLQF
jgi:iron complex outermembrane receptor protein